MENRSLQTEGAVSGGILARWMIFLIVGAFIGIVLVIPTIASPKGGGDALADWIPLVVLALWLYPIIFVHESGHLVASWVVGFSFYRFYLGPLKITRTRQGLRLQWSKDHLFSGAVLCAPTDDRHLRRRKAIFSAGGPLANLLLAVVAWRLWFFYYAACCANVTSEAPVLVNSLALLALFSLGVGLTNLLPFQMQRSASDGLHIWRMLRGGRSCEREIVANQLSSYLLTGVRPRDWPSDLVLHRIALAEKPSDEHFACMIAYYWALDTGDIPGAGAYLDRTVATLPRPSKPLTVLALEAAYFEARHRSNLAAARTWLRYGKGTHFEPVLRPRAEMAILLGEGRYEEALVRAAQGLAACQLQAPKTMWGLKTEEENLRAMAAEAQTAKENLLATAHQSHPLI
jgi:hypothetical protein